MPEEFWDLDVDWSKAAAQRIMLALVEVEGIITCTFTRRSGYGRPVEGVSFRLKFPCGMRETFERLSGYTLRVPPRICVN